MKNLKSFVKVAGVGSAFIIGGCNDDIKINKESSDTPNVLLIVVDDQGYADLSCAGLTDDVSTPNIDRLSKSGVRFTNAYASSPISSPSRGGLLTGCYQQRWGTKWYGGPGIGDSTLATIPELLKPNGYNTAYIGKVHYGSHDSDTTHRSFPLNHGFDYYFGHTSPRKHYLNHNDERESKFLKVKEENESWGQSLRQGALWENTSKLDTFAFSTQLFGTKACEYIEQNKGNKFFLQLSFNAVHNFTHQLPKEYLKENGLKGYHDWDPSMEGYYEWYQKGRKPNNPEGREHYLGQLYYLDKEIGRVMDCLESNDILKNTIVFYVSDNGGSTPIYANNYPLRGSKYLLYEGGIRVPMIISYTGVVKENQVLDNIVSGMDILPTICMATDLNIPSNINGISLLDLVSGKEVETAHDTLYWFTGHEYAVRAGKWKLFVSTDDRNAKYEMVEVELGEFLFDLETDPGETTNLANDYPEVFEQLKHSFKYWKESLK